MLLFDQHTLFDSVKLHNYNNTHTWHNQVWEQIGMILTHMMAVVGVEEGESISQAAQHAMGADHGVLQKKWWALEDVTTGHPGEKFKKAGGLSRSWEGGRG